MTTARPGPLQGLRVLDLSRLLPGPYATLVLADLGADVVRVEDPSGGDYLRFTPPLAGDTGAMFLALNRGKRSVALDLKAEADRTALLALARRADVLVEGFRPGTLSRLGVGWERLHAENPGLVLCSITGFGQNGPWRDRPGHDLGYLALAGVLGLVGAPAPRQGERGGAAVPGVQFADIAGGALTAVAGILAALVERGRTGEGRWVDVSMTEGVMSTLAMMAAPMLCGAGPAPRCGVGMLSGELPCYTVYATSDGRRLAVGALEPKFWKAFCGAIGRPELESSGHEGGEAGRAVREEVARVLAAQPLSHWVALFETVDTCVEPVLEPGELAAHPLHRARGSFVQGPHGIAQRTAIRFADGESAPALAPAPAPGADLDAVRRQWKDEGGRMKDEE